MNPSEAPRHVSATDSAASMPLHPADRHAGRHAAVDARTAVRLTCSQAYLPGMPPAAGLRPDPTPLGDQGRCGRAGDLLTARRDGNQTEGWGARLNPVPCTPPLGPAGMNPRREEITSRPGAWRAVSIPVSFTEVRAGLRGARRRESTHVEDGPTHAGRLPSDLESVLGAIPHGFKSRILRQPEQAERRAHPIMGGPAFGVWLHSWLQLARQAAGDSPPPPSFGFQIKSPMRTATSRRAAATTC